MSCAEFDNIGLDINDSKSGCIRSGERYLQRNVNILVNSIPVPWKGEIEYLGTCILSLKKFTSNCQRMKQKFFCALNGLFSKIGTSTSIAVLSSLINAYCLPLLLYASEALNWSQKTERSMDQAYSQAFYKIFKTFDKSIIKQCQFYMGSLPLPFLIDIRKLNFLTKIVNNYCHPLNCLNSIYNNHFKILCVKYSISESDSQYSRQIKIWRYFENHILQ